MQVDVIAVPYDSGLARRRMGRGPGAFLDGGLRGRLEADGHRVRVTALELAGTFTPEPGAAFELNRQLAATVHEAAARCAFPLVLAGNCISTVGSLSGVGAGADLGLVWFDAHGDFNTPETTGTGFLDGMALSVACGGCWSTLAAGIPGFHPLAPRRIVLAGARDFDPGERERFEAAGGRVAEVAAIAAGEGEAVIAALRERVSRVYVHLDLDVLDPDEGVANHYAVAGGLRSAQIRRFLERLRGSLTIAGLTVSAYDPEHDGTGAVLAAGIDLALACVEART